ncbi:MAG: hypothetical protein K2P88_10655 [Chitinophagaceae bacterium]|uniref:hypothetical protein n=1 Tax=unclassified Paraflavitalea TaxID=2798305 RepID=UPI003D329F25|nr:hypothetical protein [Chitinophagaceae bacterium]
MSVINYSNSIVEIVNNPFSALCKLKIKPVQVELGWLFLYNIHGEMVLEQQIQLNKDEQEFILPTSYLKNGAYSLHFKTQHSKLFIVLPLQKTSFS